MERRISTEILTFMDNLLLKETYGKLVMIIGATNQVNTLDPALGRNGRFTHKILLDMPNQAEREKYYPRSRLLMEHADKVLCLIGSYKC